MKAIALSSIGILLVSGSALAAHGKRPSHATHAHHAAAAHPHVTAMHTSAVHEKEASISREEREQEQLQQRVRSQGVIRAAMAAAAKKAKPVAPCVHEPVTIGRGSEEEHFALTRCDGSAADGALDRLSLLARPETIARPMHGAPLAGLHRVDPKLLERLQAVSDHFSHGHGASMHIVSGFRPNSVGSFHASAQALDFRVDGVRNEELVQFCKTLEDTGCGYYPNSSFVHMDVRPVGTGHVSWIDASGPGEAAHYVSAWPPPPEMPRGVTASDLGARLAKILPQLPVDEHPAEVAHGMDMQAVAGEAPKMR